MLLPPCLLSIVVCLCMPRVALQPCIRCPTRGTSKHALLPNAGVATLPDADGLTVGDTCVDTCVDACVHTCVHTCVDARVHICVDTCVDTCVQTQRQKCQQVVMNAWRQATHAQVTHGHI